jgi:hypothetical protein
VKHNSEDRISKVIKNQSMFNNYENSDKLEWLCPKESKGEVPQTVVKKEDLNVWKKLTMHPPSMGAYPQLGPTGRRRFDNPLGTGGGMTPKPDPPVVEAAKQSSFAQKEILEPEPKPAIATGKKPVSLSRAPSNFLTPTAKTLGSAEWAHALGQTVGTNSAAAKAKHKLKWLIDSPALVQSDKFQDVLRFLKGTESVVDNSTELTRALLSLTTYFEALIQKLFGEHKGKFENSEFFKALVADHIKEIGLGNTPSLGVAQPLRKNYSDEAKNAVRLELSRCPVEEASTMSELPRRVLLVLPREPL